MEAGFKSRWQKKLYNKLLRRGSFISPETITEQCTKGNLMALLGKGDKEKAIDTFKYFD
ncbi:hypothetical protein OU683_02205 [Salinimicrobium sp. TH3]|nr:hypothetical protein [Salinimicrobium sp. TH3]